MYCKMLLNVIVEQYNPPFYMLIKIYITYSSIYRILQQLPSSKVGSDLWLSLLCVIIPQATTPRHTQLT